MAQSLAPKKSSKRPRKAHSRALGPADTPTPNASPLLRLPPEIRVQIYKHALTSPTGTLLYTRAPTIGLSTPLHTSVRVSTPPRYGPLGLTSTCHQIALETRWLPLALNTVLCAGPEDVLAFVRVLTRKERAQGWAFKVKGIGLRDVGGG